MKIHGFPEDAQIQYLGKIFKHNHLKTWGLELCIRNERQNHLKYTSLSNLPAIAKRRHINPRDGQVRKKGYQLSLNNVSTSNWVVGVDLESQGHTFVFQIQYDVDKSQSNKKSDLHVYIPQIEFARILFLHNAYLAKNCIDSGILSREFWIEESSDDSTLINRPLAKVRY